MREKLAEFIRNFSEGIIHSLRGKNLVLTLPSSLLFFALILVTSFPQFTTQLLGFGFNFLPDLIYTSVASLYISEGFFGTGLILAYCLLLGSAFTNLTSIIRSNSLENLGSVLGGSTSILFAGCIGCSGGIIAFLGFTGALTVLPFQGTGLTVLGVLLLIYFIGSTGDPEKCSI